jgi:hypothetical protein
MIRHAKLRCEGKSPSESDRWGECNRALSDEIEERLASVVEEMAELQQPPSVSEMQEEITHQLEGTFEGATFKGDAPSKGLRATSGKLSLARRRKSYWRWTRPSTTQIAGRRGGTSSTSRPTTTPCRRSSFGNRIFVVYGFRQGEVAGRAWAREGS